MIFVILGYVSLWLMFYYGLLNAWLDWVRFWKGIWLMILLEFLIELLNLNSLVVDGQIAWLVMG
jgi:hypothetical protein